MEAEGTLGAQLSTKQNQGGQASASLLASCKNPDQEGNACGVEGHSPLSKVTEISGRGLGGDGGGREQGESSGRRSKKGVRRSSQIKFALF